MFSKEWAAQHLLMDWQAFPDWAARNDGALPASNKMFVAGYATP